MKFARSVVELVSAQASILDAPCGSGRFFKILSKAKQLTMLDLNPAMLETLQENFHEKGSLDLVNGDVAKLPFEDGSFDLCFCMRLFHHIGDEHLRRQILGQLARVSRKYVATSFYKTHSVRYLRRVILGKKPSGKSVSTNKFLATAQSVGLKLVRKVPVVSFIEQQQMVLLEKR